MLVTLSQGCWFVAVLCCEPAKGALGENWKKITRIESPAGQAGALNSATKGFDVEFTASAPDASAGVTA